MTTQRAASGQHGLLAAALAWALIGGAGCYENASGGAGTVVDVAGLPVCTWPAELGVLAPGSARTDGGVGQCVAARAYLSCEGSSGGGQLCLSDSATQCPSLAAVTGETYSNCKDLCSAQEYAVACGGPGPGPWPSPPSGCRSLPSGPGGGTISCCPCVRP